MLPTVTLTPVVLPMCSDNSTSKSSDLQDEGMQNPQRKPLDSRELSCKQKPKFEIGDSGVGYYKYVCLFACVAVKLCGYIPACSKKHLPPNLK